MRGNKSRAANLGRFFPVFVRWLFSRIFQLLASGNKSRAANLGHFFPVFVHWLISNYLHVEIDAGWLILDPFSSFRKLTNFQLLDLGNKCHAAAANLGHFFPLFVHRLILFIVMIIGCFALLHAWTPNYWISSNNHFGPLTNVVSIGENKDFVALP